MALTDDAESTGFMDADDDVAWRERRRRTAETVQRVYGVIRRGRWGPAEVEAMMRLTWVKSGYLQGTKHYNNPRRLAWWAFERLFGAELDLSARWPVSPDSLVHAGVPRAVAQSASEEIGIVGLRTSWWPAVGPWIERNWRAVRRIIASAASLPPGDEARVALATVIDRLRRIPLGGDESRGAHPREVLSPIVACLDPGERFPIVNYARRQFRRDLGIEEFRFPAQVRSLLALIPWRAANITRGVDLDDWTLFGDEERYREARSRIRRAEHVRHRDRVQTLADDVIEVRHPAQRREYRSVHRRLTNALAALLGDRACRPSAGDPPFDVLVTPERAGDRHVLIEVKPDLAQRESVRMAIGQLFDYRRGLDEYVRSRVLLAVVCSSRPPKDVVGLLRELRIDALWFTSKSMTALKGVGPSARVLEVASFRK